MEKRVLSLTLSEDIISMIKADAKALNMNPSGYVTMICKAVNTEASSEGMQEFIHSLMTSVKEGVANEMSLR